MKTVLLKLLLNICSLLFCVSCRYAPDKGHPPTCPASRFTFLCGSIRSRYVTSGCFGRTLPFLSGFGLVCVVSSGENDHFRQYELKNVNFGGLRIDSERAEIPFPVVRYQLCSLNMSGSQGAIRSAFEQL